MSINDIIAEENQKAVELIAKKTIEMSIKEDVLVNETDYPLQNKSVSTPPEKDNQADTDTAIDLMSKLIATIKFEVRRDVLGELIPLMQALEKAQNPTIEQLQINKLKTLEDRIERKISKRRKRLIIHK